MHKYKAFISYSRVDKKIANALHSALEDYSISSKLRKKKPHLSETLGKLFLDTRDGSAGNDLDEMLKKALDDSECLIVICSQNAVKSKFVKQEIEYFQSEHSDRKIIPYIIAGEPNAHDNSDIDDSYESYPKALRTPKNIVGIDVRLGHESKQKALTHLVASLLPSLDFNELWQRDKRRRVFRYIMYVTVVIIFAFSIWSQWNAISLQQQAEEAKALVKKQKEVERITQQLVYEAQRDNFNHTQCERAKERISKEIYINKKKREEKLKILGKTNPHLIDNTINLEWQDVLKERNSFKLWAKSAEKEGISKERIKKYEQKVFDEINKNHTAVQIVKNVATVTSLYKAKLQLEQTQNNRPIQKSFFEKAMALMSEYMVATISIIAIIIIIIFMIAAS